MPEKNLFRDEVPKAIRSVNLTRYEFALEPCDPLAWLAAQEFREKFYFKFRDHDGEIASLTNILHSKSCPHDVRSWDVNQCDHFLKTEGDGDLHLHGTLPFFSKPLKGSWKEFERSRFVLPRFQLIREGSRCPLIMRHWNVEDPEILLSLLRELRAPVQGKVERRVVKVENHSFLPEKEQWLEMVGALKPLFAEGGLKKVVLARKSIFELEQSLDPFWIMRQLPREHYQFLIQAESGNCFLGAPPERLMRLEGDRLFTEAIAGTRPRGKTPEEDLRMEQELKESAKDAREQGFVVEHIRDILKKHARRIDSAAQPDIYKTKNVQHLRTVIEASGIKRGGVGQLIADLHPTAAVGGLPKELALGLISEYEPFSRGFFAAPVGVMTKGFSEWIVAIRSALVTEKKMSAFSGVGLIAESVAEREWEELDQKISIYRNLLNENT